MKIYFKSRLPSILREKYCDLLQEKIQISHSLFFERLRLVYDDSSCSLFPPRPFSGHNYRLRRQWTVNVERNEARPLTYHRERVWLDSWIGGGKARRTGGSCNARRNAIYLNEPPGLARDPLSWLTLPLSASSTRKTLRCHALFMVAAVPKEIMTINMMKRVFC